MDFYKQSYFYCSDFIEVQYDIKLETIFKWNPVIILIPNYLDDTFQRCDIDFNCKIVSQVQLKL